MLAASTARDDELSGDGGAAVCGAPAREAADDAAAAALELRLDEALEDMIMASAGYGEASEPSTTSSFLGAWVVTDDSHEMSDSGGEESVQPTAKAAAPKKSRKRPSSRPAQPDAVVSGDERKHRRRSDRKRSGKPSSKRPKTLKAARDSLVPSVSVSSLSDASRGPCRVRLTKPKQPKPQPPEEQQQQQQQQREEVNEPPAQAPAVSEPRADEDDTAGVGIQCLPERAEYRCTLCSEEYSVPSVFNPWWALVRHECPKCHKQQFPSINIASPANQISFTSLPSRPQQPVVVVAKVNEDAIAANASTDDDDTESNANFSTVNDDDDDLMFLPPKRAARPSSKQPSGDAPSKPARPARDDTKAAAAAASKSPGPDKEEEPDTVDLMIEALARSLPDDCKLTVDDVVDDLDDDQPRAAPRPADDDLSCQAAHSLFDLFEHARFCSGRHRSSRHAQLCACTKFVMLHLRDCAGTSPDGGSCPFSWCGPCRRALAEHLA